MQNENQEHNTSIFDNAVTHFDLLNSFVPVVLTYLDVNPVIATLPFYPFFLAYTLISAYSCRPHNSSAIFRDIATTLLAGASSTLVSLLLLLKFYNPEHQQILPLSFVASVAASAVIRTAGNMCSRFFNHVAPRDDFGADLEENARYQPFYGPG